MMKFKERDATNGVTLIFNKNLDAVPLADIERKALKAGALNMGYHFVLRSSGLLERGISESYYGSPEFTGYKDTLFILCTSDMLTDAQSKTLNDLLTAKKLKVIHEYQV